MNDRHTQPVDPGDRIRASHRDDVIADIDRIIQRLARIETKLGIRDAEPCRNCLAKLFFVGLFQITADAGNTYTAKEQYCSNDSIAAAGHLDCADMDTTGDNHGRILTVTALNDIDLAVGDQVIVLGTWDAGDPAETGKPVVRYMAIPAKEYEFLADEIWIHVETTNDGMTVTYSHIGPDEAAAGGPHSTWDTTIYPKGRFDFRGHFLGPDSGSGSGEMAAADWRLPPGPVDGFEMLPDTIEDSYAFA